MAALPFHYYLALREDWIDSQYVAPVAEEGGFGTDEAIDFNAQSLKGEAV